ncbi:MAG: hypothetical protein ACJ786_04915, partial [Catenulispora sp.]
QQAGKAAVGRLARPPVRTRIPESSRAAPRLSPPVPVQRGLLDELKGVASGDLTAVRTALTLAAQAATDPSVLPRLLTEVAWESLPDLVRARIVDDALRGIRVLISSSPGGALMPAGPASVFADAVRSAGLGAIDRLLGLDPKFKVPLVDRLVRLWARPTPEFAIGYLSGFISGVWDGITGPFVLLRDLSKLGIAIQEAEGRFLLRMTRADQRRTLMLEVQQVVGRVNALVGPLLQDVMGGRVDPAAIMAIVDRLVSHVLSIANDLGASMADAFVRYLQQPDRELGHGVGWLSGTIVFELLLAFLTSGGYTAVKEALSGFRWVAAVGARLGTTAAEAAAALRPLLAALSRFQAVLAASPRGAAALEVIEELFRLFLRYFELSYGIESKATAAARGGEHGAAAGERVLGTGERVAANSERSMVNALGETHEFAMLIDGRIIRCSENCARIAENLLSRSQAVTGGPAAEATAIAERAQALERESTDLAARGLTAEQRAAEEAKLLDQARDLERQMSELEQRAGAHAPGEPGPGPADPPADGPATPGTGSPYDRLSRRDLRRLARTDPAAAAALVDRYWRMSDRDLRGLASRGDETAQAVLRQRIPPNDEALARALGSEYRPPHSATVTVQRPGQGEVWRQDLTSGNMTAQEAAVGYPRNTLLTHTESRAVRQAALQPGDVMTIMGQYNPCQSCQQAMREAAARTGATINYRWMGGAETFRP